MSDRPTLQFPSPLPEPPEPAGSRQRWLYVLITVLTVLVLALPIAMYLLLRDGDEQAGPAAPAPTSAAPASPSAGPVPTRPAVPDGRISLATLGNSTLDVPSWPADNVRGESGRLHFQDGVVPLEARPTPARKPPYGEQIVILAVTYGDVDHDGADETIAELGCMIEGGSKQLVAFDRDRSGRIITLGTVVATTGEIRDIRDGSARVTDGGTVTVQVGDYQGCCGDETPQKWQQRGYRLGSKGFGQSTGPTRMPANPYITEITVTAGRLTLSPATDGYRYGSLDVTVRHVRSTRPDQVTLRFYSPTGLEPAGDGWPTINRDAVSFAVDVDAPAAPGSVTYTYAFRLPLGGTAGSLEVEATGSSQRVGDLRDTVPWNNTVTVPIRSLT
jgi:hypothetical protein